MKWNIELQGVGIPESPFQSGFGERLARYFAQALEESLGFDHIVIQNERDQFLAQRSPYTVGCIRRIERARHGRTFSPPRDTLSRSEFNKDRALLDNLAVTDAKGFAEGYA